MSYLITDEEINEVFENHVATLKVLDEDTQTLEWKEPGTGFYQADYVFHKYMLFISGDLGTAAFACTWCPKWDTNDGWLLSLDYFVERMSCISGGEYVWNSERAVDDLKEEYIELFGELDESGLNEMNDYIISLQSNPYLHIADRLDLMNVNIPYKDNVDKDVLLQYCLAIYHALASGNETEYINSIQNDRNFVDLNDFWEWGYKCGRRLNPRFKKYLAGLQMAYKQLKERETK